MEASGSRRPWLIVLVCSGVAVLTLLSTVLRGWMPHDIGLDATDPYGVKKEQIRFAPVVKRFPPKSTLGVVTDLKRFIDDTPLMAIQFVLAPRQSFVVEPNRAKPEWAVGAFRGPVDPVAAGAALGYEIVETFDTGLVLYRYRTP